MPSLREDGNSVWVYELSILEDVKMNHNTRFVGTAYPQVDVGDVVNRRLVCNVPADIAIEVGVGVFVLPPIDTQDATFGVLRDLQSASWYMGPRGGRCFDRQRCTL